MAADYVDRAALRTALYEADAITMRGIFMLNQFPAAAVVEDRHGTWEERNVEDPKYDPYGFFTRRWYCSACGDWQTHGATRYCCNCGARMDGES